MWKYISSFFVQQAEPKLEPPSVTLTAARFPADGSPPHLMTFETVPVDSGPYGWLFHAPDLRPFWQGEQAWRMRDIKRIKLERQPDPQCNGTYVVFFTGFPTLFPPTAFPFPLPIPARGDVFVVKLQPHEFGEHAWAAYGHVPREFLSLPVVTGGVRGGLGGRYM